MDQTNKPFSSPGNSCPICGDNKPVYQFILHGSRIVRCPSCELLSSSTLENEAEYQPKIAQSIKAYNSTDFQPDSITEKDAAEKYCGMLKNKGLKSSSRILLIADPGNKFIEEASKFAWEIDPFEPDSFLRTELIDSQYDAAVVLFQLEKTEDLQAFLGKIHNVLKTDGLLMTVTPSLDSRSAQFFGSSWTEWRPENHHYFNNTNIQLMLWRAGFNQLVIRKDKRIYTLSHIQERARSFPGTWVTRTINAVSHLVIPPVKHLHMRLPCSGIVVIGRKCDLHNPQICSFIVPAYNECATFSILMDTLLAKEMPQGIKKEIVIIESNSKDGTREQVLGYKENPEVKIILQDRPMGKGNAVRTGFEQANGDILLIQDADLEYDLNDIDLLLDPILRYQIPFVLGSRHGGRLKMRHFEDQQGVSTFLNFGHILFTTMLNLLYKQHLKDPFTMYKVFRRDCLYGLHFECNRFDFDHELVVKLARKGYQALEIPINYHSRSFKEGKKIRVFKDPITWIKALIKYRFVNIYKDEYLK